MKTVPAVSIIVPVYNVRDYIAECVRSLKAQTFQDFEVVFVDDGSTDGSLDLALSVADGDERFRGVRQENAGPATARNRGFEESRGAFIMFMDPDDWHLPGTVGLLHSIACENDLDYLDFTAHTFYESDDARHARNEDWYEARRDIPGVMTGPQLFVRYMENEEYSCSSCFHFFRRELMADTGLRQADGMYVHEDELFSPQLIAYAKRAMYLNVPLYQRRVRASSLMTSGRSLRNVVSMFHAYRGLEAWIEANGRRCDEAFARAMRARVDELRGLAVEDAVKLPEQELFECQATMREEDRDAFLALIQLVAEKRRASGPSLLKRMAKPAVNRIRAERLRLTVEKNRRRLADSPWQDVLSGADEASAEICVAAASAAADVSATPALSILVPIYNAEPYLRQCLDSLVNQTLRDLEIICIDDGSTDNSAAIIDEYAKRDDRIHVISKANSGYGDSMNRGVAEARGEWIGICEPDDFCDMHMYAELVKAGRRFGCDIVKANYREHVDGKSRDSRVGILDAFSYGVPFDPHDDPRILLVAPTIWTGVYRRSMLQDAGISFSPTPGASFQDASFAHQCWTSARSGVLLRPGFYHYRVDNAAASSKSTAKVFAVCGEYERTFAFLREKGDDALRAFGPTINVMRHGVYIWNYNRIAPKFRPDFARRWASEMAQAHAEGLLDVNLMTPGYLELLGELLDDPDAFCRKYPDEISYPPIM